MLNPKANDCVECNKIENLLSKIDCKLSEFGKTLYNNLTLMLNKSFSSEGMIDLLHYKRILTYKYNNINYASEYTIDQIVNKLKLSTSIPIPKLCNVVVNLSEIYSFQYKDLNEEFRDLVHNGTDNLPLYTEEQMLSGVTITYDKIGKVGFIVKNNKENPYLIYDLLGINVTEIFFDYVFSEGISYYISKDYVTFSNVYYRFIKNI